MENNSSGSVEQAEYLVALDISSEELLKYYRGNARSVLARALDGSRCRFPVDVLKPFVTHSGVQGTFRLTVQPGVNAQEGGKLIAIDRVSQGNIYSS